MERDYLKDVDILFDNNKELINKLSEEKRLLENMLLNNSMPEELKKDILEPYDTLTEVIDKRVNIYRSLRQARETQNMIGLLYNEAKQGYLSSILKNLQEICRRRDVQVICFTLENVNLEDSLVEGLVVDADSITQRKVSIPKYNLNIGCYLKSKNTNIIRQMQMTYGLTIVNPVNNFNQASVFDILSSVSDFKKCILPVSTLSPSIIAEYLDDTSVLFLLPERGFHNNSAVRIEKRLQGTSNRYRIEISGSFQYCDENSLYMYIKRIIANRKYVAVKGMRTLLWNGSPLEARIYVQKDITGKWDVTGMIAKNDIFTNGSIYKDTVDELERVLGNIIPDRLQDIRCRLEKYALNICSYLDYYFLSLGNCTVDFILDVDGAPFLIAFGGWDQKDYLFKINGKNTWDRYLTSSFDYLLYLQHTGEQDGNSK